MTYYFTLLIMIIAFIGLDIALVLAMSAMGTMHIDVYPDGTEKWRIQFDGDPTKILKKHYVIFRVRKKINAYDDERGYENDKRTGEQNERA